MSKFLVGMLPIHGGQSFVFVEVTTFLATKHNGLALFQLSNGVLNS